MPSSHELASCRETARGILTAPSANSRPMPLFTRRRFSRHAHLGRVVRLSSPPTHHRHHSPPHRVDRALIRPMQRDCPALVQRLDEQRQGRHRGRYARLPARFPGVNGGAFRLREAPRAGPPQPWPAENGHPGPFAGPPRPTPLPTRVVRVRMPAGLQFG